MNELSNNSPDRSNFTTSDLPSGVGSANKLAQEDFNKMYMLRSDHELIVADKDKWLNKLEDKLELKESEVI